LGEGRTADPLYLEGGGIFVENVVERGWIGRSTLAAVAAPVIPPVEQP